MCNDGYEVFQKFTKDEWGHAWKHVLINLCPPRSRLQEEVRCTRDLLRKKPVKACEESACQRRAGDTSDHDAGLPLKKKGKKARKEIFECHAILKEFWQGWQNPYAKIASLKNLVAVRKSSFISLPCLVDDWKQLRWHWCFDTIIVIDFRAQQLTWISW